MAVKGLGGFHLMVDARDEGAVKRLRQLKAREAKPFALMVPSVESAKALCEVSGLEARVLASCESPIVLLERSGAGGGIAGAVAPHNPYLGIVLPYTPLHHVLMSELGFPVVATSGNLSEEPICTDEREALARLGGIADLFLVHDRPIARHVDDSIVRVMMDRELVLRRARGYAPFPIVLREPVPPLLAVGGHLKNTIATSVGRQVFVSQHIGDLETAAACDAFGEVIASFRRMHDIEPVAVACDGHPDYKSTKFAEGCGIPVVAVQHHYAHVLSCMAENEIDAPVLGVSWDGTGYGLDGGIWGGEFLHVTADSFERVAHLRPFRLPGGDKAVKEPRRSALGLLYAVFGQGVWGMEDLAPVRAFEPGERSVLDTMLERGVQAPMTTSAGRLFDGIASIMGLRQEMRFEGQAAMELEFACSGVQTDAGYEIALREAQGKACVVDWEGLVRGVLTDVAAGLEAGVVPAKFHNTLVEAACAVARRVGEARVALTGGCFQNRYLTQRAVWRLRQEGFLPYWHQRVPPNDGGVSLGQIVGAARALAKE